MSTCARARAGFASIVALMMIALVGGAILGVTILLRTDVNRTQDEARDAQLRQLIIAAAQDLAEKRHAGTAATEYSLKIPTSLRDVAVRVRFDAAGRAIAIARIGAGSFEQSLDPAP